MGACADSLYSPQSDFASLFSDRKAVGIGDVIYVLITETAQASQNMVETTSSETDGSVGPGIGKLKFLPLWGYTGKVASEAKGSTQRSESLVARVAATVTGISATGNLLIEGERLVQVHKDHQVLKITGEVRPKDISADNTVPSYKVANARISYTGSNPRSPRSKVGIVTRLLHMLF